MGWWQIDQKQTDRLNSETIKLVSGDGPADVMDACLERIKKQYLTEFGRKPYRQELESLFNFCAHAEELVEDTDNPLKDNDEEPENIYRKCGFEVRLTGDECHDELVKAGLKVLEEGLKGKFK